MYHSYINTISLTKTQHTIVSGRFDGNQIYVIFLYSGVCLYAMLVGTLPFIPDSPNNLSQLHSLLLKGCEIPNGLSEGNIYLSAIIHFIFKGSIESPYLL